MTSSITDVIPAAKPDVPAEVEAKVFVAPQWKLVWWKFRKHKIALISGIIMILIYTVALFADFLAPFDPSQTNSTYLYAPPQAIHFVDEKGNWRSEERRVGKECRSR